MGYHSFLIKSAVGKDRSATWKLLRALSIKPGLPPIPGSRIAVKKPIVWKAPALASVKEAPAGIPKHAISFADYRENMKDMLQNLPEDHPVRKGIKRRILLDEVAAPALGGISGGLTGRYLGANIQDTLTRKYGLGLGPFKEQELGPLSSSRELMPTVKGPGAPRTQWGYVSAKGAPGTGVFFHRQGNQIHALPVGGLNLENPFRRSIRDVSDEVKRSRGFEPPKRPQYKMVADVLHEADPKKLRLIRHIKNLSTVGGALAGVGGTYLLSKLFSRMNIDPYYEKFEKARYYKKYPEIAEELFRKRSSVTKEAVRGMLRSKIRFMPQTPEFAAALPKATEAVSAARGYLQSMASANLDPGMLNKMNQQQRNKYLQMILGRGNASKPMQRVRSILPTLPKDLKGLLM